MTLDELLISVTGSYKTACSSEEGTYIRYLVNGVWRLSSPCTGCGRGRTHTVWVSGGGPYDKLATELNKLGVKDLSEAMRILCSTK